MNSSHTLATRIGVAGLLISGSSMAFTAHAANTTTKVHAGIATQSIIVSYDELNPNSDAGIRAIYAKLKTAATQVCGHYEVRDIRGARDWQRCHAEALNDAVARTRNARIAALHQSDDTTATATSRVAVKD